MQCWCSWWFRWTTTSVQTGVYLRHQRRLTFEANSLVFIDWSCDIERKAHSSHSRCPPLRSPSPLRSGLSSTPQSSLLRADKLIDQLSEWPFYYNLEIRTDFFFLLKRFQVYISFAWDCSGFGWWLSNSPFCRWHPTGGNYGSQLPWALGTALTNKSKLLEWNRSRTYSKQHFPALSHRVL